MKTLLAGHTHSLSKTFYQQLKKNNHLVVISDQKASLGLDDRLKRIHIKDWQESILNVFSSHSFDSVVYFLSRPEEETSRQEEVEELVQFLDACTTGNIKKIVIVTAAHLYSRNEEPGEDEFVRERRILSTCDDLCQMYKERYALPLTVVSIPFLFSLTPNDSYLSRKIKELSATNEVILDGEPTQTMDFLSQQDLAVLIERILLEPQKDIANLEVPGAARLTVKELTEVLRSKFPTASIHFSGQKLFIPPPTTATTAFETYHFQPEIDLRDQLDVILHHTKAGTPTQQTPLIVRWQQFNKKNPYLLIGLELTLAFIAMHYLNYLVADLVPFRTIDFRLLYVVIFAAVHGHKAGLAAAVIAEIALYLDFMALEMDWRILFYHVENWIPFAIYLIVGAVLGFIRDQSRLQQANLTEENNALTDRYVFLGDMYKALLDHKVDMEKKIISSQENFGRLFATQKRLSKTETQTFFTESLHATEELLNNNTISFYQMSPHSDVAHLIISSTTIQKNIPKKLSFNQNKQLKEAIQNHDLWVNKSNQAGYPSFVYPITINGKVELLLNVHEVTFENMNTGQEQLFQVTGSLISTALQRLRNSKQTDTGQLFYSPVVEMEREGRKPVLTKVKKEDMR